ncbi:proteinase-activated receptor 3 [Ammospiza nelsoni]|uniref:proteinase-activated receptor 3 n=1 Tax=Ammospiza caudacuta TaxID=2857398 RepID=UPI0027397796|nr:proteinase-activated receptor 3 [Ammospiza caudacuta]XP_059348065.1 proteinase-activated receptor 3 [Ammospiza nelsoni]
MKTLFFTGLLSFTSSLCTTASEFSWNGSAIKTVSLIKTFRGISARDYDYIPPYAIEGETTTIHIRENKCTSKKSNDSTLAEVSNTTLEYLTSSLSTQLIPAVYLSALLLGVPSNAIILWMLLFRIRSVCTAVLYTNLAVSDLLFCIVLPFKIAYHINGNNWVFGETMCRAATAVFYGNMYCSILLLTCISVTRYLAIVHPFTYKSLPKRAYAIAACAAVWAAVFLYMLPLAIMQQSYYVKQLDIYTCHDVHSACETVSSFQFYYYGSLAVFGFLIPLATIVFCYVSIIRTLKTHEWFWYVKVSLLILTIFAICFVPSNIILIIHHINYYYYNTDRLYSFYLIALCLSSLNSCLDPFLYFLMSKIRSQSNIYLTMVKISREK